MKADKIEKKTFRRLKHWLYPLEAVRETVLNALAHRDWTRSVDIEITRYNDRLEVISPGALPNSMDVEKMKAGRRTPRNPLVLEVLRDYGYVDARGMGVRFKVIPLVKQFTGREPIFEATDDYLKTLIPVGDAPENNEMPLKNRGDLVNTPEKAPEKKDMPPKNSEKIAYRGKNAPKNLFQRHLLDLIRPNPVITYDILAKETGRDRKTVRRHIGILKQKGLLKRLGPAKGGHWEVVE